MDVVLRQLKKIYGVLCSLSARLSGTYNKPLKHTPARLKQPNMSSLKQKYPTAILEERLPQKYASDSKYDRDSVSSQFEKNSKHTFPDVKPYLSGTEKSTAPPKKNEPVKTPIPPKANVNSKKVISLTSAVEWKVYVEELYNLTDIQSFAAQHRGLKFNFCVTYLDKSMRDLSELKEPSAADLTSGRTNGKMADFVVRYAQRWLVAIESCDRMQGTEWQTPAAELKGLIEAYLTRLKLTALSFKPGDDEDDWQELEIPNSINIKQTNNQSLIHTIAGVERQPREISYLDEDEIMVTRTFGGKCTIWVEDNGEKT